MEIIRDGSEFKCSECGWKGTDYDIPDDSWTSDSCMEAWWWIPLCPICKNDLLNY